MPTSSGGTGGAGDRNIGGGGGARLVFSASLRRSVYEAGISSVTGQGEYPTGSNVYQAARRQRADSEGLYVIRIFGYLNIHSSFLGDFPFKRNSPRYGDPANSDGRWLSHTVSKQDVLQDLEPVRFGFRTGGSGDGADVNKLAWDTHPEFNNTFLRTLSEISGFSWDTIETVQFFN